MSGVERGVNTAGLQSLKTHTYALFHNARHV